MVNAVSELDDLNRSARIAREGTKDAAAMAFHALPWLGAAIDEDRAADRFCAWGRSTVVDENTGTEVIPEALFDALHERAGVDAAWPIGNAGLLHSYGYLLSTITTPYGLKRERWLGESLSAACGLPPDAFHPWRAGPTLLARASAAASALLAAPAASASLRVADRETRVAVSATSGPAALAYAVAPALDAASLLVTLFPVAEASAPLDEFTAAPRLRWNAA